MKANTLIILIAIMQLLSACKQDNITNSENNESNSLSIIPTDQLNGWDSGVLLDNQLYVMTHNDDVKGIVAKYINIIGQDSSTGITMFFNLDEKPFYAAIGDNYLSVSQDNDTLAFYKMTKANTFQGVRVKGNSNNDVNKIAFLSKPTDWKFGFSITLIAGDAITRLRDAINQWKFNNQNSDTPDFAKYNQYTSYTTSARTDYPYINVCETPQNAEKKYNEYINNQKEISQDNGTPQITDIIGTEKSTNVYVQNPDKADISKEFKWVTKEDSEIRSWKEDLFVNTICKEGTTPYIYNYDYIGKDNMYTKGNGQVDFLFPALNGNSIYHFRPYTFYSGNSPLYGMNNNQVTYGEEKVWSNIGEIKSFDIENNPPYTNYDKDIWAGCYFMPKIEIKASITNAIENIKEWGIEVSCGNNKERQPANKRTEQGYYIFTFDNMYIGRNDLSKDYSTYTATAPISARVFIILNNDEIIYGNKIQKTMNYCRKPSIKFTSTGVKEVFCKKCGKNVLQPYWEVHADGTFWMDETKYIKHGVGMIWQSNTEFTESDFYIGDGAGGDCMQFGYTPEKTIDMCYKHFRYGLIRAKEIHYVYKINSKETSSDNAVILHWKNRETRNEETIITSSSLGKSSHQYDVPQD